jgi:hypothetical protein
MKTHATAAFAGNAASGIFSFTALATTKMGAQGPHSYY